MSFSCGPVCHFSGFRSVFHPCFIRGSRISCFATFRDDRSVAKELARASAANYLAKPKVRPLLAALESGIYCRAVPNRSRPPDQVDQRSCAAEEVDPARAHLDAANLVVSAAARGWVGRCGSGCALPDQSGCDPQGARVTMNGHSKLVLCQFCGIDFRLDCA